VRRFKIKKLKNVHNCIRTLYSYFGWVKINWFGIHLQMNQVGVK